MVIQSIQEITGRIAAIEAKFGRMGNMLTAKNASLSGQPASFADELQQQVRGKSSSTLANATGAVFPQQGDSIRQMVSSSAKRQGVDPKLAMAVAKAESNFDSQVVSEVGAQGVMQLMPDTARALGVNPQDTKENIEGGVAYLRQMLQHFQGDPAKAVAAYNAGPGAVETYGGVPPYGETQEYVKRVLKFMENENEI